MPLPVTVGGKISAVDINNIGNFPVSTFSALPASGNWLGRQIAALDTGITWRWNGSAWVVSLEDTGWITPELNAGWTGTPGELPAYRRLNGVVYLSGRANTTAAGAAAYALPVGFRPSGNVVGRTDANNVSFRYIIFATGNVGQASAASAVAFSFGGMAAFVADA